MFGLKRLLDWGKPPSWSITLNETRWSSPTNLTVALDLLATMEFRLAMRFLACVSFGAQSVVANLYDGGAQQGHPLEYGNQEGG